MGTAATEGRWGRIKVVLFLLVFCGLVTALHFTTLRKTFGDWTWSVPVDDTYIHLHYARGIANGHPFQYHAGDGYSTGCTSPLYVVLLAGFFTAGLDGLELVPVTIALGGVWLFLTLLLLLRLGKQLYNPTAGRLAAALWGTWGFAWYCMHCGMETGLWVVMILAVLSAFISWSRQASPAPRWYMLLLAGLALVPDDLLKAAEVDGAGAWTRLWRVTIPLIKPAILVALLFRTLDAFRIFDNIYVLTGGSNDTSSVSILGYNNLFKAFNIGLGSAISVLVFVAVAIIAFIFIRLFGAAAPGSDGEVH